MIILLLFNITFANIEYLYLLHIGNRDIKVRLFLKCQMTIHGKCRSDWSFWKYVIIGEIYLGSKVLGVP